MATQEQTFLQEITSRADDDEPRLVYADWLSEQGDPRGDYIRMEVDANARPLWDPIRAELEARADLLLRQHRADWCRELRKITHAIYFRRGMVDRINVKASRFPQLVDYFERQPLRDLNLDGGRADVGAIHDHPFLARLRALRFRGQKIGAKRFSKFFESPHCKQLELLDLHSTDVSSATICEALSNLPRLRSLVITSNDVPLTSEISRLGVNLRHVQLPNSWFGWRVPSILLEPRDFPRLESIGNWGYSRLFFDSPPESLSEVGDVSYETATQLFEARGQECPPLRGAFRQRHNDFFKFAQWLTRTKSQLALLSLTSYSSDSGQRELIPHLAQLHTLHVQSVLDESYWFEHLLESNFMPQQLRVLDIDSGVCDGKTLARYLRSEAASHLVRLRICQHYRLEDGDEIIDALLQSKHLERLTHLLLTASGAQRRGLTARFGKHACQFTTSRQIYPRQLPQRYMHY